MREYKFRGKRIDNGEWVYGSLYTYKDSTYILLQDSTKVSGSGFISTGDSYIEILGYYGVDPETVGQYTGLKDSEDKEIYEGDIVIFDHCDNLQVNEETGDWELDPKNCQQSVVEDHGEIEGDFGDWSRWIIKYADQADYIFEVIGNTIDNKEL